MNKWSQLRLKLTVMIVIGYIYSDNFSFHQKISKMVFCQTDSYGLELTLQYINLINVKCLPFLDKIQKMEK